MAVNGTFDFAGGLNVTNPLTGAPIINGDTTQNCTQISTLCPVDATVYGYYPNMGANAFFLALFASCCIVQIFLGIKYRTWTYLIGLGFGTLAEAIGYAGRALLHNNPWSSTGFEMQICCLIIAPAFIAAGVYLTLKHIVLEFGASFSLLRPKFYTWIFILCDIFSLILQGAGGGTAATANGNENMQKVGTDLMITGIVFQVCTLLTFGFLVADYALRASKNPIALSGQKLLSTLRFKLFLGGLVLSYLTIFTRCVFRIAEMANGWRNPIMQSETDFIVLDGVMISIATLCLTIFHPGLVFKEMQMHGKTTPMGELKTAEAEKVADVEATPAGSDSGRRGYFGSMR